METYKKFPYQVQFPDSSEGSRNCQTLEDALHWARWTMHRVWKEDCEWGREGEPTNDATTAVITNRNTAYQWIMRRGSSEVEFKTLEMVEESVAEIGINLYVTVEEAEALARAAKAGKIEDRRTRALMEQALDQIGIVCRQVRDRVRAGDKFIDAWSRSIPRSVSVDPQLEQPTPPATAEQTRIGRPRYRPLGDPDNLSLKEAGEILGKARNTVFLWYKQGKLPPAVDVGPFMPHETKPVIVVPRYRLEAWQSGERMPKVLQEVFETHSLREPPWVCWSAKKGAAAEDIAFWVDRRSLRIGTSETGKRIYGEDLQEDKIYVISPNDD